MTSRRLRRGLTRIAVVGASATALITLAASPALADTATANANAAQLQLAGGTLLTTGLCSANSPGGITGTCGNVPLALLGTQTTLGAGLLAQQANAAATGLSSACAGAVGNGGTIQIGAGGACQFTAGNPSGGVQINLGPLATIKADAIIAECTASSTVGPTSQVQLVNASLQLLALGVPVGAPIPLGSPGGIAPNTPGPSLGGLLNLTLNEQLPALQGTGKVTATALDLNVLGTPGGTSLIHVTIGTVSCGPNAVTPPVSSVPLAGAPIAGGIVLLAGYLGWRFWWTPRQRAAGLSA